jgi:diaminohydroxyphosphoribosylaminopyrimidine deaminase/5-amino-6-(5-phosphoribosylamino)uracil reductase
VVIAASDPNPAAGGGAEHLRAAGLRVDFGVCREEALRLNAAFFWSYLGTGPFVALKLALSTDGAIAASTGERTAVTGSEAQAEVHRLRAGFDAVLVGSGTADIDDPLLTVRGQITPRVPPVRIVLDADLSLSPHGRLSASAKESPVWLIAGPMEDRDQLLRQRTENLGSRGVVTFASRTGRDGRLDPRAALELLATQGVRSVLCEGGAKVAEALLDTGLVHRLYLFLAPTPLGRGGVRVFGGDGLGANWISSEPRGFGADTLLQLESEELMTRLKRAV